MSEPTEQASERKGQRWGRLERGWRKVQLINELAAAELTERQLATKYDVAPSSINEFRQRHREEINRALLNREDEFAALWVANKANRLAEYEEDINAINDALQADSEEDDKLRAAKHRALRAVAEELGQLPNRLNVTADQRVTVEHRVTGLDVEKLK